MNRRNCWKKEWTHEKKDENSQKRNKNLHIDTFKRRVVSLNVVCVILCASERIKPIFSTDFCLWSRRCVIIFTENVRISHSIWLTTRKSTFNIYVPAISFLVSTNIHFSCLLFWKFQMINPSSNQKTTLEFAASNTLQMLPTMESALIKHCKPFREMK